MSAGSCTKASAIFSPQTLKEYKCGICEKVFHHNHRKNEHSQFVPKCREYINGACRYEQNGCWFRHCDLEPSKMQAAEAAMMDRLFKMMEHFTERINNIENQL